MEKKMQYFFFEIRYLCEHMQNFREPTQTLSVEMGLLNLKIHSLKRYLATLSCGFLLISSTFCLLLLTQCVKIVRYSLSCTLSSADNQMTHFSIKPQVIFTQFYLCLVDHSHKHNPYWRQDGICFALIVVSYILLHLK